MIRPCVFCYATLILDTGHETIVRYTVDGDDHAAAAQETAERLAGHRVRRIETFAGEPRTWTATPSVTEVST